MQIIVASTRPGRVGPSVTRWIETAAKEHGGFADVELIDLLTVNLPLMDEPHAPAERRYVHAHTKDWSTTIARADAYVFVTPEYNGGFNVQLKNAIDYLFTEWRHKPVGLVGYGATAGGARATQMLKSVVSAVGMTPVDGPHFVSVHHLLDDNRELRPAAPAPAIAGRMFDELHRLSEAFKLLRDA
ncbi:NADPH-dependent FMN reductase [Kutzneria sp. NPDC052558]|uniref:NADPH-dependent FMN reductase n=1 Tax=Kutzneria sp. NPDC052558 TaxID=3364121 RepID=UPI0037C6371F